MFHSSASTQLQTCGYSHWSSGQTLTPLTFSFVLRIYTFVARTGQTRCWSQRWVWAAGGVSAPSKSKVKKLQWVCFQPPSPFQDLYIPHPYTSTCSHFPSHPLIKGPPSHRSWLRLQDHLCTWGVCYMLCKLGWRVPKTSRQHLPCLLLEGGKGGLLLVLQGVISPPSSSPTP